MENSIRTSFLLLYATLILLIISIFLVASSKRTVNIVQTASASERLENISPADVEYLHTEWLIEGVFSADGAVDTGKFQALKDFIQNHNLDLVLELSSQTDNPLQRGYAVYNALKRIGLNESDFSIRVGSNPELEAGNARVKLSWSKVSERFLQGAYEGF